MRQKVWILALILTVMMSSVGAAYAEVPTTHWAYSAVSNLSNYGVIETIDSFELGQPMTESLLQTWLSRLSEIDGMDVTANPSSESSTPLTRLEAVKSIIDAIGFGALAGQLDGSELPFTDVTEDAGYVQLAYAFGFISVGSDFKFRPNDVMRQEEAAVLINAVMQDQLQKLPALMSYYAISSYSQSDFSEDLTDLIYGWSQFVWSDASNDVVLDTSSTEYRIPSSYDLALDATNQEGLKRHLMVTVSDKTIVDPLTGEDMKLVEYLLSHPDETIAKIKALMSETESFGFEGVLIDFEGLKGSENADALTAFLNQLSAVLKPQEKTLLVAVHPVMVNYGEYFDGYDFKGIGAVADAVILMAHDYYPKTLSDSDMASGLTITPLAPISQVYYALDAILDPETGVADKSKVILQLSMDTVQWKLIDGAIINRTPYHPVMSAVAARLQDGAAYTYSEKYESPNIVFESESDGARNIVWFEDATSVQAKIDLAKYYGIGGISVWRLGNIPDFSDSVLDVWNQILSNYTEDTIQP